MSPALPSRSKLISLAIAATLLVAAIAVAAVLVATRPRPEQHALTAIVPRVVVVEVDRLAVRPTFGGYGVAAAFTRADVPSRISSTVLEVPEATIAGSAVAKGQLLVQLDASDFERQLQSAEQQIAMIDASREQLATEVLSLDEQIKLLEEDVELARTDLERVRAASAEGAAREREVDRARQVVLLAERAAAALRERRATTPAREALLVAQRSSQESVRRQAATDVERCHIESPVTGVLQSFDLKPGEMVRAGAMVARVVDASRIEVPLRLPAGVRPLIKVGDTVELRSTDRRDRSWPATVSRIAPEDDQRSRTFTVWAERAQDPARPDAIAPGMFLEATISSAEAQTLSVVPRRAIRANTIFIVEDGRVRHLEIEEAFTVTGPLEGAPVSDREWVALRNGPEAGTLIVLDAARVLPDGGRIEPVPPGAAAPVRTPTEPATRPIEAAQRAESSERVR